MARARIRAFGFSLAGSLLDRPRFRLRPEADLLEQDRKDQLRRAGDDQIGREQHRLQRFLSQQEVMHEIELQHRAGEQRDDPASRRKRDGTRRTRQPKLTG